MKTWMIMHQGSKRKYRKTYKEIMEYMSKRRGYTFEVLGRLRLVVVVSKGAK